MRWQEDCGWKTHLDGLCSVGADKDDGYDRQGYQLDGQRVIAIHSEFEKYDAIACLRFMF